MIRTRAAARMVMTSLRMPSPVLDRSTTSPVAATAIPMMTFMNFFRLSPTMPISASRALSTSSRASASFATSLKKTSGLALEGLIFCSSSSLLRLMLYLPFSYCFCQFKNRLPCQRTSPRSFSWRGWASALVRSSVSMPCPSVAKDTVQVAAARGSCTRLS